MAAHTYTDLQPCVNCDIYKEKVGLLRKNNWGMNKTCQDFIPKKVWINFVMDITEE